MTDKSKIQFLTDRFKKLDANNNATYKFSVTALYDDPDQQPFTCALRERGAVKLEEVIAQAIKNLKPDSLRVDTYATSTAENPQETNVFRISPSRNSQPVQKAEKAPKEKERSVADKIEEYLAKLEDVRNQQQTVLKEKEALYNQNINLLGSVNESNLDKVRHEHQIAMINLKHELEVKELERKIAELEEELSDTGSQLTESLGIISEHQKRIDREGKLENSARDITAIAKGALSVAPGLMKLAGQYGLGGFATALTDDSSAQEGMLPSSENQTMEGADSDKFAKIQAVMQFCNALSEDDLDGFITIVQGFEKNPGTMKDIIGLMKS